MSGLEPVAALALACNILQIVETGYKTVDLCRRIYDTGQADPAVEEYSTRLLDVSEGLSNQLKRVSGPLSQDDLLLRDLAEKTAALATELVQHTASLSARAKSIRSTLQLAFKSTFKKHDLKRLEKSLRDTQSTMETQLLVGLRHRLDANLLQQDAMDLNLKHFMRQLSAGQTHLSSLIVKEAQDLNQQLSLDIKGSATSTKAHVTAEASRNEHSIKNRVSKAVDGMQGSLDRSAQDERESAAQERAYDTLLKSFKFPDMAARRNQVPHTFSETFEWIFDPTLGVKEEGSDPSQGRGTDSPGDLDSLQPDRSQTPASSGPDSSRQTSWDSFVDWLQSPEPIYLISGKPTSGKSTLMKFISSHQRTADLLQQWHPNTRMLSHFFWRPGTELQQSIKGLLCSLLYQLLLWDKPFALGLLKGRHGLSLKESPSDWDTTDLRDLLLDYLHQTETSFCLFIDGLDEVWPDDGVHNLVDLLDTFLRQGENVKLCVSSRREHALESRLQRYPQLRIHELIRRDLEKYATHVLRAASTRSIRHIEIEKLIKDIVFKAQGVFLWVVFVTKSLSTGIENGDSLPELTRRLDLMPRSLENLYRDMWLRLNEDHEIYRRSSSLVFSLLMLAKDTFLNLGGYPIGLVTLMAAMDDAVLKHDPTGHFLYNDELLVDKCRMTISAVRIRCAGLLEVYDTSKWKRSDLSILWDRQLDSTNLTGLDCLNLSVLFIHRSAQDFLTDTEYGLSIWKGFGMSFDEVFSRLYNACFVSRNIAKDRDLTAIKASAYTFLRTLAYHRAKLSPQVLRRCLEMVAMSLENGDLVVKDQSCEDTESLSQLCSISVAQLSMLQNASIYGFYDYVSEQLSMAEMFRPEILDFLLSKCCYSNWVPFSDKLPQSQIVDCYRLMRLFLSGITIGPLIDNEKDSRFDVAGHLFHLAMSVRSFCGTDYSTPGFEELLHTFQAFRATGVCLDRMAPILLWWGPGAIARMEVMPHVLKNTGVNYERLTVEIPISALVEEIETAILAWVLGTPKTLGDIAVRRMRLSAHYFIERGKKKQVVLDLGGDEGLFFKAVGVILFDDLKGCSAEEFREACETIIKWPKKVLGEETA